VSVALAGKRVVITGAASGIGRALAEAGHRRGASLLVSDLSLEALDPVVAATGADALAVDVRREADVTALAARAEALGGADVIVNNAGISLSDTVGSMRRADFERVMDVNFWGVVRGTEAFLPQLRARPWAAIVNVSSLFGLIGVPSQSAYCASKFAVRGFSESLRLELAGTGVRVHVVHPGGVKTNIVRSGTHHVDTRGRPTDVERVAREFDRLARTSPDEAAEVIWRGVEAGQDRILVGADARLLDRVQRLLPTAYARAMAWADRRVLRR
jgi:NAD(P)-dependent dehydrogenase (short-subunit alcohol dehydrogenase family)